MIRLVLVLCCLAGIAQADRLLLQSTTSTQNSGLYDHILPLFEAETGIDVQVVAVGTGQAIRNAQNGDADVLIVHAKAAEEAFVAAGYGLKRHELMYNDFVLLGPKDDPAGVYGSKTISEALQRVAGAGARFVSRGDDSGTHQKELSLWAAAGIKTGGSGYLESGSGMGATVRMATELGAYTLSDRATWIAYRAKDDTTIVYEGDPPLNNQYSVILINPARHDHINAAEAKIFRDWLLSEQGQDAIGAFRVADQQLFFPNAR